MKDRHDVDREDILDLAIDAVKNDRVLDGPPPDRVTELLAKVRQVADRPYPVTITERLKNMKTTTKVALAASVLIVFFGLLPWLVPGSGVALAFGDVAEALSNVRSATWKTTSTVTVPPNNPVTVDGIGMFLAPSHWQQPILFEATETLR